MKTTEFCEVCKDFTMYIERIDKIRCYSCGSLFEWPSGKIIKGKIPKEKLQEMYRGYHKNEPLEE